MLIHTNVDIEGFYIVLFAICVIYLIVRIGFSIVEYYNKK